MGRPARRLSSEDRAILQRAHQALERPSFAARLSGVLGTPVQAGLEMLPPGWHAKIRDAADAAIARALDVAIVSLRGDPPYVLHDQAHRTLALASGALGGFFGLPGVLLELPFTTVVILRSIADVAHSYGEDLDQLETRLACMQVFAVGGRSHGDDNFEIGYYEVRAGLGFHLSTLAAANGGLTMENVPGALELVRAIAARFGMVVSDKLALQMVPLLGAATGALINNVFMCYFQEVARGHFAIRDLERRYGAPAIEAAYRRLTLEAQKAARRHESPPLAAVVIPPPGAGAKTS
jgi:hypothetical protein